MPTGVLLILTALALGAIAVGILIFFLDTKRLRRSQHVVDYEAQNGTRVELDLDPEDEASIRHFLDSIRIVDSDHDASVVRAKRREPTTAG
ncbi:MAG: hypothetical protein U0232_23910 [Thermomicrobiales bacterium]